MLKQLGVAQMRITNKLRIGLAIPTGFAFLMGILAIWGFFRINQKVTTIYDDRVVPIQELKAISDDYAILVVDAVNKANEGLMSYSQAAQDINEALENVEENWDAYLQTALTSDEEILAREVEQLFQEANEEIVQAQLALQANNSEAVNRFDGGLYAVVDPLTAKLQELVQLQLDVAQQERIAAGRIFQAVLAIYIVIILATIIAIFFSFWIIRDLKNQMLRVAGTAEDSSLKVTTSATQIAASGKQLEATMTEQVASTNEVSATSEEIAATSSELVRTMTEVAELSQSTAIAANSGREDLMHMEGTMRNLADATVSISSKLGVMSEKANNINSVVTTITKVADQTNLLSLNAAIEAEKAGEFGAGFAVVAREIRRLADQTAVATLEIEGMVKEMQSAVSTGVMEMDKFSKEVANSVDDVRNISGQIAQVIEQVQSITPRFTMVNQSMDEQAEGAKQISMAMDQLSEASQQTTDSLRDTNSALDNLDDAAQDLQREISIFKAQI